MRRRRVLEVRIPVQLRNMAKDRAVRSGTEWVITALAFE